ncbi:14777_t:CDS:2 [Cetraspora pellucida]|uniref:14777_t:CDS:1 n=1 Tax=Cetraspora pellucida TaxID=1433469 RepID=A0ACA9MZD5_9GLOM|nr:14777_t:CDS:2 [Cetraspora pellucida]
MSNQQSRTCIGCHTIQNYNTFLNEKGIVVKKCSQCRTNIRLSHSKNELPDMIISHLDITETVYNSLTSLNNTDEFYEEENERLELNFNVELSSLLDAISDKELQKENIDSEIGCRIIAYISEGDGYSWVYHTKNQKKKSFLVTHYCNCQIELRKRQAKHPELIKQRDTPTYLERYNCEETINIEILSKKYFQAKKRSPRTNE